MKTFNKKGQFGPDAFVGMVLVAILGLGGVFFLNTFVSGLALQGLLSVLDEEVGQSCEYMLFPLMGDEYIRTGTSLTELDTFEVNSKKPFLIQQNYFGGESDYMYISMNFNETINKLRVDLQTPNKIPVKINNVDGFIAEASKGIGLGTDISKGEAAMNQCFLPVYSPVGKEGTANLYLYGGAI